MPEIFSSDAFMPHGYCYLWKPGLVWLHLTSDLLIALAYTTIPFTLLYFIRKRQDVPFRWIFVWFGLFIVSCGGTHVLEAWNLYHAHYWLAGLGKAFTAVASLTTAFLLVRVVPEAIALPSPDALRRANEGLRLAHQELEGKVEERTLELSRANTALGFQAQLLASVDAAVLAVDRAGRIVYWNTRAEESLGWPLAEVEGCGLREALFPLEPDAKSEAKKGVWEALDLGRVWQGELAVACRGGGHLLAWVTQSPRRTGDGAIAGAVWLLVDLTEHRRTEAALKQSEHIRNIFAHAAVGMAVRDLTGRFAQVNPALCSLLGYRESELLATDFQSVSHPDDLGAELDLVRRMVGGEMPSFTIQKRYVRKEGDAVWAQTSVTLIRNDESEPKSMVAIVQDFTSYQYAQEALSRSRRWLLALFENARDAILVFDNEGRYVDANPAATDLLGYSRDELLSLTIREVTPVEDRDQMPDGWSDFWERGGFSGEYRLLCKDGSVRPAEFQGTANVLPGLHVAIARDVTARKHMEEEREALLRRLVQLQEEERRSISRELHDEVGQLLTGLRLMIEHSDTAGALDRREEMKRIVNELIGRVRDLSMSLRPPMLDDLGVLPTLLWLIERFEKQAGLTVDFRHQNLDGRFPRDVELTAVRVVQEALTNVAKHARVTTVRVEVWADEKVLGARIEDQGRGFNVPVTLGGHSSGLSGMRERCRMLQGSLHIESTPGKGACLRVELPLSDLTAGERES